jgi:prolyl-tRNA synthetase
MLDVYAHFAEHFMAMPVLRGLKTAAERFPGAVETYSIEAMMQDCKALQAGTSHFLGQNFARASEIKFQSREGTQEYAWTTSWGVSTRMIGGLIMTHSDDDGLVLPPRIAPAHVVILPILHSNDAGSRVREYVHQVAPRLRALSLDGRPVVVEIDDRDARGGQKQWEWVKKGIPIRLEVGQRDIERGTVSLARRDRGIGDKMEVPSAELPQVVIEVLADMQDGLFERAKRFRMEHMRPIGSQEEFFAFFTPKNQEKPEVHGGFAVSPWCGSQQCEMKIKEALKVTIRCIPIDPVEDGKMTRCVLCGAPKQAVAVFAKSY